MIKIENFGNIVNHPIDGVSYDIASEASDYYYMEFKFMGTSYLYALYKRGTYSFATKYSTGWDFAYERAVNADDIKTPEVLMMNLIHMIESAIKIL
jgi:hypothetical protein